MQKSGLCEYGTVSRSPREGTEILRCSSSRALYNLVRVQSVAGLTARLPEHKKSPGVLSLCVMAGGSGRIPKEGRKTLLPGAGSMGVQMPPAGYVGTLNRRDTNSPAPELCSFAQFG